MRRALPQAINNCSNAANQSMKENLPAMKTTTTTTTTTKQTIVGGNRQMWIVSKELCLPDHKWISFNGSFAFRDDVTGF